MEQDSIGAMLDRYSVLDGIKARFSDEDQQELEFQEHRDVSKFGSSL